MAHARAPDSDIYNPFVDRARCPPRARAFAYIILIEITIYSVLPKAFAWRHGQRRGFAIERLPILKFVCAQFYPMQMQLESA